MIGNKTVYVQLDYHLDLMYHDKKECCLNSQVNKINQSQKKQKMQKVMSSRFPVTKISG